MKEFLKNKGFKVTPQRELVFRSFLELGRHVSVDELCEKVREEDRSIGYSTVWRNLKLICKAGLAEEVNIGDGITRYDRVTREPHGHFYCLNCKKFVEFNVDDTVGLLEKTAKSVKFSPEVFKIEVQGYCKDCSNGKKDKTKNKKKTSVKVDR